MRTTMRYSSLLSMRVVSNTNLLRKVSRNLVLLRRERHKERFGPILQLDKSLKMRLSDVPGLQQATNVETRMATT